MTDKTADRMTRIVNAIDDARDTVRSSPDYPASTASVTTWEDLLCGGLLLRRQTECRRQICKGLGCFSRRALLGRFSAKRPYNLALVFLVT
jgi:hypothetical protein